MLRSEAISFSVVARPPRVRSRRQWISIPALSRASTAGQTDGGVAQDGRLEFKAFADREDGDAVAA